MLMLRKQPPKPHAFTILPLQSAIFNIIKRNHFFSINHARSFSRHIALKGASDKDMPPFNEIFT